VDTDKRLREAYMGHSRFYIVDNNVSHFNLKIDKCVDIVSKIIGLPSPSHHHKKFLIRITNPEDHASLGFPPECIIDTFEVIETIIKPPHEVEDSSNVEIYLRKRGKTNAYSYTQ